jgi:hypothetical protein
MPLDCCYERIIGRGARTASLFNRNLIRISHTLTTLRSTSLAGLLRNDRAGLESLEELLSHHKKE